MIAVERGSQWKLFILMIGFLFSSIAKAEYALEKNNSEICNDSSYINCKKTLRLEDTAEDYARLGLKVNQVEMWEDGRRTPQAPNFYEWWYFDGIMTDGTIVVVTMRDNFPVGTNNRLVQLQITLPTGQSLIESQEIQEPGYFAKDRADVRFGNGVFSGDLDSYTIKITPKHHKGIGCDLQLRRSTPSYRPATGHISAGNKFFAWVVPVPGGEVSGTITLYGHTAHVFGNGYHDHNWGNTSPAHLFEKWWWGRSKFGDHTVIIANLFGKPSLGGLKIPIFFMTRPDEIEYSQFGDLVQVREGQLIQHPDVAHVRPIPSSVTFTLTNGAEATFFASKDVIHSKNLLDTQPWYMRIFAGLLGLKPWYTRFKSQAGLNIPLESYLSEGTLEYYELE